MSVWIALFRGINVGGRNSIPMAELREDLSSIGLRDVRTYIQSGNVVFTAASRSPSSLATKIRRIVKDNRDFQPEVIVLCQSDLENSINRNPFKTETQEPKSLHFFFLAESPAEPKIDLIESAKSATENYRLVENVFYLHAPDGIARSKLARNVEAWLGVTATARNFRTVEKIQSMIQAP